MSEKLVTLQIKNVPLSLKRKLVKWCEMHGKATYATFLIQDKRLKD